MALVVACAGLFAFQFYVFRVDFERDLAAVASIISANCTGAISFDNEELATKTLLTLGAKPHIIGAAIILPDRRLLARVGAADAPSGEWDLSHDGLRKEGTEYIFIQPVTYDGERIGTLILHPDYQAQSHELFRVYAGILAIVLAISFAVAAIISWRLEQVILEPLRYLAELARKIASQGDYSVRALKFVDDELGSFTDSFNRMLDQVQSRESDLQHEISERRRAEMELQRVHQQLVDASRHAGMAEIATGVLHNVGNVLNSVNVSATLIVEHLSHSKAANLVKAGAMLRAHHASMAEYLNSDPKGKLLPGYIADVTQHMATEQAAAHAELELLLKNIEHIKDIVARQQSYARVSGFMEELALTALIEDAVRMNAGGFERHCVVVTREYEPMPNVVVDKHKVLQILVNIMRNAKYAMDEAPIGSRFLNINLKRKGDDTAELRVSDTGIGIPAENLTKIFSHGFTTRKEGHGFGLHSAALAAQQMKGRLTAQSDGLGCGATFILELPLADPNKTSSQPTPS